MTPRVVRSILLALAIPLVLPHTGWAQAETPAADSLWAAGDMAGAASAYRAALADHPDDPAEGGIPHSTVAQTPVFQSLAGNPDFEALMESIRPCNAPEYRQFDFWIGEWVVRSPTGQIAGTNSITSEYDGCLLVERWQGAGGGYGTSQNFYHEGEGRWRQNWIDSQASGPLWLAGGLDEEGSMVMTDVDAASASRNRITWTPLPDGSVRQHWQQSSDGGETWGTVFDGLYVPRDGSGTP